MSLITPADFTGEVSLPNTDTQAGAERIQRFIANYEPEFLRKLLGSVLYNDLVANLNDEKYRELKCQVKPILLRYVYYWILRDSSSYVSGTGMVVQGATENSTIGGLSDRLCKSWNDMARGCWNVVRNWDVEEFGPYYFVVRMQYTQPHADIFHTINSFGI